MNFDAKPALHGPNLVEGSLSKEAWQKKSLVRQSKSIAIWARD